MTRPRRFLAAVGVTAVTLSLPAMVAHAGTLDPLQSQRAGVMVFEQEGYAGASASLGPGNRSAPFDAIHSIQVLDGYSAEVCTGSRGRGTCLPIAGSTRDLGTLLDDPVTWVKVRPQPQSPATTTTTTIVTTTTTIRPAPTTAPPAPPTTAPRTTTTTTTQPSRTSTTGAPAAPATTVALDRPDPPATTAPSTTTTRRERGDGDTPEEATTTTMVPATPTAVTASETTTTSTTTTTTTPTTSLEDQDEDEVIAAGPPAPGPSLPPTVVPTDGADRGWRLPTIAAVSIGLLALYTLLLIARLARPGAG